MLKRNSNKQKTRKTKFSKNWFLLKDFGFFCPKKVDIFCSCTLTDFENLEQWFPTGVP